MEKDSVLTGFMYEKDGNLYLQEILPYSERERGGETDGE